MKSKLIEKILKETPLEIRVKVSVESFFINEYGGTLLMPLDENGNVIDEAVKANEKCIEKAKPLLKIILKSIEQWKKDGCPQ